MTEQDRGILDTRMYSNCHVGYILSLGVCTNFRKQGVASLLLDSFLNHVTQVENQICKAIYLHVLTMNSAAIRFYEKHYFRYFIYHLDNLIYLLNLWRLISITFRSTWMEFDVDETISASLSLCLQVTLILTLLLFSRWKM